MADGTNQSPEKTFKVYDPATEELIIELPDQTPEEIDEAIDITNKAFAFYKKTNPTDRSRWLRNLYNLMIENLDDCGNYTWENGKCLTDAIGEVKYAASYFEWFAEEAKEITVTQSSPLITTTRWSPTSNQWACRLALSLQLPFAMAPAKAAPAFAVRVHLYFEARRPNTVVIIGTSLLGRPGGFP